MYLSKEELTKKFGADEIGELTSSLDQTAADELLDEAIAEADAMVNSYLSTRYAIPVDATKLVKRLVAAIARYELYDDHSTEEVKERYDDALRLLKDIAAKKADLAGASSEDEANTRLEGDAGRAGMVKAPSSAIDWSAY